MRHSVKKLYEITVRLKQTKFQLYSDDAEWHRDNGRIKFEGYSDTGRSRIKNVIVHDEDVITIIVEEVLGETNDEV